MLEDVDVEVAEIAGNEESDDLTAAIGKRLVPACPAVDHQVDVLRLLSLADQIAARRNHAGNLAELCQCSLVVGGQAREGFEA